MKYPEYLDPVRLFGVAPFAGAWIEIVFYLIGGVGCESLPSRERGLKFINFHNKSPSLTVAPFAGAWIEIL